MSRRPAVKLHYREQGLDAEGERRTGTLCGLVGELANARRPLTCGPCKRIAARMRREFAEPMPLLRPTSR